MAVLSTSVGFCHTCIYFFLHFPSWPHEKHKIDKGFTRVSDGKEVKTQ